MREGVSQSEIARRLHISRQAVNQLVQTIPARVTDALYDAAKLNGVEPRNIDTAKGILLGYSRELQTNVVITMHPETGLRVWHQHNLGRCKLCSSKKQCKSMLLKTIHACGVQLTTREKNLDPSKLAGLVFSKVFGREFHSKRSESKGPS
jgi:predicted transcriptional regulator